MTDSIKIPIPVLIWRGASIEEQRGLNGDQIDWRIGDPAWAQVKDRPNFKVPVVIDSKRMGHWDAPGKAVFECIFIDEDDARYAVTTDRLSIREGWKP